MTDDNVYLTSDNWSGAHPNIVSAMVDANEGAWKSYGLSDREKALEQTFCEIFEIDLRVYLCASGTAANALGIAAMSRPGDVLYTHTEAHVRVDECGAPIFLSPGLQIEPVAGSFGKINPFALQAATDTTAGGGLNAGRVGGLSITQATEAGTVYSLSEIDELVGIMRNARPNAPIHMDGARFANALAALQATPAEMTWKRGVDILSFGATKNGCWCAEVILVFNSTFAEHMDYLRKRAGHLVSKMRFMTAQFEAYFRDDLWLTLAKQANNRASQIAEAVNNAPDIRIAWDCEINEVFAVMPAQKLNALVARGIHCALWQPPTAERSIVNENEVMVRFVASWATSDSEIEQFERLLHHS
ncbi:MAG: beta-eliminating lyase-related protein [Pseudomonadota bacterium]